MNYRRLGDTELEVSEIGLACWPIGTDAWTGSEEEALAFLKGAYDLGVNFYDVADSDGAGRGEELLGKAFAGNREMVVLATKVGYDFYNHPEPAGRPRRFDAEYVQYAVDRSLERLGTDYLDLLQLHDLTMEAARDEALWAALQGLRAQGKVKYVGAVLGPGLGYHDEGVFAMRNRGAKVLSTIFNLLEQDPGRKFFTVALESMTGIVVRDPFASGILDGSVNAAEDIRPVPYRPPRAPEWVHEALRKRGKLGWIREGKDMTLAQAILKVYLWEESVPSVLVETVDPARLQEWCEASEKRAFSREEIAEIAEQYRRNFDIPKAA